MEMPHLLDGRLKIRHLLLVDALTRDGSVVAAARTLHTTQPAATRSLQELEDLLGVDLYERRARGVVPTAFGAAFTAHARAVLAQLTSAGEHLHEIAHANAGRVTVGTHLAGTNLLLPRAISRLKREHPRLTVAVREGSPETLLAELETGRVDLVVGRIVVPSTDVATTQHVLYDEPIVLVVRAGHPASECQRLTLADLTDYPWIIPGSETVLRRELEKLFLRSNVPLPENRVESTSILTVRHLLSTTDVIAALPKLISHEQPDVVELPVSLEPLSRTVGVTTISGRRPTPSAAALFSELTAAAQEMREVINVYSQAGASV